MISLDFIMSHSPCSSGLERLKTVISNHKLDPENMTFTDLTLGYTLIPSDYAWFLDKVLEHMPKDELIKIAQCIQNLHNTYVISVGECWMEDINHDLENLEVCFSSDIIDSICNIMWSFRTPTCPRNSIIFQHISKIEFETSFK